MLGSPELTTRARKLLARLPLAVFVASVGLLAWRITRGIDMSDESYYAIFLDEWLKEGIAATPFLVLHQTAALLTYPFVLLHHAIVGSTAGLLLYLRCLFLVGSTASALVVVRFLRDVWPGPHRWLVGAFVVAFVPYNLPAPSYNTMGGQAFLVAGAALGCAVLAAPRGQHWRLWLLTSAAAWTVAVMAYPSLLLAVLVLGLALLLLVRPGRRLLGTYALFVGAGQLLAWATVCAIFGLQELAQSLTYTAGLAATTQPRAIPAHIAQLLAASRWSAVVFLLALFVGVLRRRLSPWVTAAADAALFGTLLVIPPALFHVSHSIVLAAALGGVALLADVRRQATLEAKLLAVLTLTSWIAGVAMAGAATLGPLKVPLGALLAACITIAVAAKRSSQAGYPRLAVLPAVTLWTVLAVSMFDAYYGEPPEYASAARVHLDRGPFAGLTAAADDARVLRVAQDALRDYERAGDTLAVLGRYPGFYLESKAPVRALLPYAFNPFVQPSALRTTHDYYAKPENRPSLVLVYYDQDVPIINPFAPDFDAWYVRAAMRPAPRGRLEVFRRRE
jgi:hypothetical protein